MAATLRTCSSLLSVLVLLLSLAACGGGGGSSQPITIVDPAPAYTGLKSAAVVTTANAEDLAMGAYTGGIIGATLGTPKAAGKAAATSQTRQIQRVAGVLNNSLRRMQLPRRARERALSRASAVENKRAAKVETFEIYGDQGGMATFSVDMNQTDGTFAGTVTYNSYASNGVKLSGSTDVLGTYDANFQGFTRLTLSFRQLSLNIGDSVATLVGSVSWGYNPAASSESLTINMVLIAGGDTYWFRNYEQATVYGDSSLTQTLSGRYYDPYLGYVDFSTPTALVAQYGNSWPSRGEFRCSGDQGGSVSVGFEGRSYTVRADLDNNGVTDWETEYENDNQPPPNSAPVANAGSDRAATQATPVTLDGSGSYDPDSDPLTYYWSFDSYPAGVYPAITGYNTATPSFVPRSVGTYVLRLTVNDGRYGSSTDTVTVTASALVPSQPGLLQQQWQYGIFGTSIGQAGLLTADLTDDGSPEVIASASTGVFGSSSFWYVLQRSSSGEYQQLWRSKNYGEGVVRLVVADVTGDGKDDIIVGVSGGAIEIYSGATLQLVKTISSTHTISAMAVADLEGDGSKEIVTSDGTGVYVYSVPMGALEWSLASGGGNSIAIGNVDGDPALEIVSTIFGGKGYVIDGVQKGVSWEYLNGFGSKVALGELDGDGMQEIVAASSWYKITVFDADRKTPVWEITTSQDIGSLLVADADGDSVPEIVYGDGQSGRVVAVDAVTRLQRWAVSSSDSGVSGIALADVDLDGSKELLWGAGGNSTGADHLYIAAPTTGTVKWKSAHIDGPLSAVAVGDVDDDGEDEILMISYESDSGYGEGIIHIFNARTHALEYREKLGVQDWMGVRSVEMGDVDGDGRTEFVVTTGNIYDGVIRVYNGATHALKKQSAGYNGNFFSSLAIGDVDGDGRIEIVAGQGREHSGATGSYLLVLDGVTLQEKWRSVDTGAGWSGTYDLKLSDIDGDGHRDIVAASDNRLIVYDGVTHDLKHLVQHDSRAIEVADVDGDGTTELLVGRSDGMIDVLDGGTLALDKTVGTFSSSRVDGLRLTDLDGDGNTEWLVASGGVLTVLDAAGGLKWRSGDLAASLGLYNHIGVKDCDGDGRKEIYLGSMLSLYQFE